MSNPSAQEKLLKNFQDWRVTHAEGLDTVFSALEDKDYTEACRIMNILVQHAAQAAVAMQGILIRAGKEVESDE